MKIYKNDFSRRPGLFLFFSTYYDDIHDISVWLQAGYNPADAYQFRSHTGKTNTSTYLGNPSLDLTIILSTNANKENKTVENAQK